MKEGIRFFQLMLFIVIILISGLSFSADSDYSDESKDYFLDIAIGSQYGDDDMALKKWTEYIKIYIQGDVPVYLKLELNDVIKELNELTNNIELHIAPEKESSNIIFFGGSGRDYVEKVEPNAEQYVTDQWGLNWCYWNKDLQIFKGSFYIDTTQVTEVSVAKHMLRELLAKTLGLMGTSEKYEDSIFYKNWSETTFFSEIDKEVIEMLYRDELSSGMSRNEVKEILAGM